MADLPSILGGMAQGFLDFGKSAVDLFGTGGAAVGDLVDTIRTGKVSTKNQDDFRKWLYNTDSVEDAAAKGLGTALNGVQTVTDYIPGIGAVTKNPLFNAGQGALGGLADEFKTYGKDYDLGRAGERAAVSAGAALASGGLGDALKKSANPLLSSGAVQGLARGATSGAITGGGYAAIDGGDVLEAAKQGAGMGALIGGATGAFQDFKPAKTYDVALTDDERQARIANIDDQLSKLDTSTPEGNARYNELMQARNRYNQIKKYGGATAQPDYLGDEKYSELVKKAKNYKTLDRFEKMNNPIKGSEIWGEKPKSYFERDSRAVRINMFPNDATKGTGLTKQYLLNMFKDAYDEGITDIVPSYGSYTKDGASFMDHLAEQGWVKQNGRNGYNSYEIAPKIAEWQKTNPLADIYNAANSTAPKALETTLADADMAVNNPKLSPEQEAYFKDSVIRDENGNLKQLYHGSPNGEFYTFDMKYANPENDWGKGFYFTDNEADVHKNYVGGGPDFDNKVTRRAEQIADEQGIDYDAAEKQARNEMYKDDYLINAYTNLKNPATVGKTNLFDGSEYDVQPLADYDNLDDYYNDLIYNLTDDVINDTNIDYDAYKNDLMGLMSDAYYNGGIGLQQLKDRINNELWIEDYDGNPVGNDVARSIVQNLGYDGIIDPTVSSKFNNMGIENGTTHYIAFEPNQIKNTNNLNPTENPDIRYSKATPGQSLEKTLAGSDAEINRVGSANVAPVDPATLPESMRAVKGYIDKDYIKDIEKYAGKKYADISDSELLDYALSKRKPEDRDIMRVAYEDMIKGGSSARKIAENTAKNNYLSAIGETEYSDASGDGLMEYLLHHGNQIGNGSRTKAADIELSDRLGIAPGNTFMRDNANPYDSYGSYSPYDTTISIGDKTVGENAIGTIGHERLHSFQTEALMNRYDKEVLDAYRDLSKDLDKYIKNDAEIAKLHADDPADLAYWGNKDEQQARMLQQYLENKNFTKTGSIRNRAKEWGNEINPAFDKFFDKLRDLSKRGVALPALTALFGGGAYMASQNNDKEKEVK